MLPDVTAFEENYDNRLYINSPRWFTIQTYEKRVSQIAIDATIAISFSIFAWQRHTIGSDIVWCLYSGACIVMKRASGRRVALTDWCDFIALHSANVRKEYAHWTLNLSRINAAGEFAFWMIKYLMCASCIWAHRASHVDIMLTLFYNSMQ